MMSIAALGAADHASAYCLGSTREDYYTQGGDPLGVWAGSGIRPLGLTGTVHAADFEALLRGDHPNPMNSDAPAILVGKGSGSVQHRAGWDCTFSAPKSVSVLWALSEQQDRLSIESAHEKAVAQALAYLEDHAAYTRRGHGGVEMEAVSGLIAAQFKHFTSRAGDPQMHTHCIVMNVAPREDGSFGTLESKPLFDHKMAAGAIYRMALGTELVQQGYQIDPVRDGFEMRGVSTELRQMFSKRREQIEEALAQNGGKSAAASQIAALATRKTKMESSLQERLGHWREEARQVEFTLPIRHSRVELAGGKVNHGAKPVDLNAVISGITQSQSTFTRQELVRAAAVASAGVLSYAQLETALQQKMQDGSLIRLSSEKPSNKAEHRYTTAEMLHLEASALETAAALAAQRHGALDPTWVMNGAKQIAAHEKITLSAEQLQAVAHITSNTGRLAVVEGWAGTGKTMMLKTVRQLYEQQGIKTVGCSLSGKAAQNLQEGSGIVSNTLHRLLFDLDKGKSALDAKTVVVLDEAAMVGSRQMDKLLRHINRTGAKLVLVGDSQQLQPIDAGQMFELFARELGKANLTEIRRQNESWARDAVRAVIEGKAGQALQAFDQRGMVHRSSDLDSGVTALAEKWLEDAMPMADKLVVAGTRLEAYRLNQAIRAGLIERGQVHRTGIEFTTATGGVRQLASGDRIVFLRNDLGLGVKNGTLGVVTACSNATPVNPEVTVKLDDGKAVKVPLADYAYLDHGYALTVHKSQGTTVAGNVYVLTSDRMTDKEWSYVALSRAKGETRIFTTSQDDLQLQRAMERSRQKDTALEYGIYE